MKRTSIHTLDFTITCETGLHIGGSQDELVIGGSDNPVVKSPASNRPYVPGSSLKGKMRAELERASGKLGGRHRHAGTRPCGCARGTCPVCRVFGAHMNTTSQLGPSRIIVRDAQVDGEFHLENKSENVINRKTGAAEHPRQNERVGEGAMFRARIVLQVFDQDDGFRYEDRKGDEHRGSAGLQAVVADALYFVQMTGLGGGISRGSGAVKLDDFRLDGEAWKHWSE